jgi:hypothetical protein
MKEVIIPKQLQEELGRHSGITTNEPTQTHINAINGRRRKEQTFYFRVVLLALQRKTMAN